MVLGGLSENLNTVKTSVKKMPVTFDSTYICKHLLSVLNCGKSNFCSWVSDGHFYANVTLFIFIEKLDIDT